MKISKKLLEDYRKHDFEKLINLSEVNHAKNKLNEINSKLANRFKISESDSSFKVYISIQNLISYFAEELSALDEFIAYYDTMIEMDDEFMPSYPPNSPISGAYFAYWGFFDFKFGEAKETIGTIFYDIGFEHKFDKLTLRTVENLNNSSMRFYKHMGFENDLIKLKDLLSGELFYCISTSSYLGEENEIWFIRLVPNLDEIYDYQIILTTPYIILGSTEKDWIAFFDRQKANDKSNDSINKLKDSNSNIKYWHNYIMEGYSNYESNCIFLTGIPDIKGSKPHEQGKSILKN